MLLKQTSLQLPWQQPQNAAAAHYVQHMQSEAQENVRKSYYSNSYYGDHGHLAGQLPSYHKSMTVTALVPMGQDAS